MLTMAQFDGLVQVSCVVLNVAIRLSLLPSLCSPQGYNAAPVSAGRALSEMDLFLFSASGDLYDLIPAVVPSLRVEWTTLTRAQFATEHMWRSSCSALVRVPA